MKLPLFSVNEPMFSSLTLNVITLSVVKSIKLSASCPIFKSVAKVSPETLVEICFHIRSDLLVSLCHHHYTILLYLHQFEVL